MIFDIICNSYVISISMPIITVFMAGFFGRYFGKEGILWLYIPGMLFSLIFVLHAFYYIGFMHNVFKLDLFVWLNVGLLSVEWGILFDSLSVTMIFVVTFISFLVHLYSLEYMGEDPHLLRFMLYLSLFTFFMLILVISPNYLQLFFGWEGVGLSSYLLINFWFTRVQANKAALKAMLMNRVGDSFFGVGIMLLFYVCGTVDFGAVFSIVSLVESLSLIFCGIEINKLDLIAICFFFGAVGKSAQLGLHSWLPDATEGPTPVSALIHAATMVTAGVFLLIRSSPLLDYCPVVLNFIIIVSAVTIVFGSSVGMFQNDIKRVVAYSTTSQLGYMILACGLSSYNLAMFHLVNHAFFKALLFLCSGAVIHALADEQDMRKMGGLVCVLPFIYFGMLVGSLALAGLPFLSGYYSKEAILEVCCVSFSAVFGYWLGAISTFFTVFYSFRLLYWIYYSFPNGYYAVIRNAKESSWFISISLFILIIGSIFVGYMIKDLFVGFGADFWGNSINVLILNSYVLNSEFLGISIKLVPLWFSFFGFVFFYVVYYLCFVNFEFYVNVVRGLIVFFTKKWFFDILYNIFILLNVLKFSYQVMFKVLDRGAIEWIGPYGLKELFLWFSEKLFKFNSGYLYHYFLIMFVFIVAYCFYYSVYFIMDVYSFIFFFFFLIQFTKKTITKR